MKKLVYYWSNGEESNSTSNLAVAKKWLADKGGKCDVKYEDIKPKFKGVPYTKNPKSKFYREGM